MLFVNKGFLTVQQITTSLLIHFGQVLWMLNEDSSLITVKKILLVTLPTQGTMHFWIWTGFNIQSKCLLQPLALHFLLLMFCKWVELPSWTYILQSLQSFGNDNFVVNGKCSLNLMVRTILMFINFRDLQSQFFLDDKKYHSITSKQNCFGCIAICQSKILLRLKLFRFFSSSNYWFQYYLQMCRARRIWKATREVAKWNDIGSAKFISSWRPKHITNLLKRNRRHASGL